MEAGEKTKHSALSLSLGQKVQDHNFRSAGRHTGEMAALRAHAQSGSGADGCSERNSCSERGVVEAVLGKKTVGLKREPVER